METEQLSMSGRVAQNVRRLRLDEDLTLASLSERLAEQGHPIGVTTLSKIELGQRRIDVDDLVALARVLGTTETYLLSDPMQRLSQEANHHVTQWRTARAERIAEVRRLDAVTAARWQALVGYASSGPDQLVAVESVLLDTYGEDEIGEQLGRAALGKLLDDLAALDEEAD